MFQVYAFFAFWTIGIWNHWSWRCERAHALARVASGAGEAWGGQEVRGLKDEIAALKREAGCKDQPNVSAVSAVAGNDGLIRWFIPSGIAVRPLPVVQAERARPAA
jgi:hypothetical protein